MSQQPSTIQFLETSRQNFSIKDLSGYIADSLIPGDFNADGNVDIAIFRLNWTNNPIAPIQILKGDGSGHLVDATSSFFKNNVPTTNYVARSLVADLNNDGLDDIFCIDSGDDVQYKGGQNKIYLSTPGGQLVDATYLLPQKNLNNHGASIGDVNNDGLLDILNSPCSWGGNDLEIQNSQGQFISAGSKSPNSQIPNPYGSGLVASSNTWSSLVDVNQDGYLDAILGTWTDNPNPSQILLNKNGDFYSGAPIALPRAGLHKESVMQIKAIDLNGDRFPDLAISMTTGGDPDTDPNYFYNVAYIQLLVNKGDGTYVDETSMRLPQSQMPQSKFPIWYKYLNIVDINKDGYSDIVAIGDGSVGVVVFLNDGQGNFGEVYRSSSVYGYGSIQDLNNDGLPDLITSNHDASDVAIWMNQGVNDHIYKANFGGDKLLGSLGDDEFYPQDGHDYFDGNGGVDKLYIPNKYDNYVVQKEVNGWVIKTITSSSNEIDIKNIERLIFADQACALDTDSANSAGGIYRLYQAAFDRKPDLPGLGYWIKAADNGKSAVTMAEDFTWSKEFLDLFHLSTPKDNYFTGVEVKTLVEGMYTHVLHRAADTGGLNYYSGVIQSHEKTVGRVLAEISDSPENHTAVASSIANGIQYTPYTAQAMTSLHLIDDVEGTVAEPQTMALDTYSSHSDHVDLVGQTHDTMLDWMWLG